MKSVEWCKKSIKFDFDLVFDCRRSKHELLQEMMFVNMCVKFCDNRKRNEVSWQSDKK